MIIPWLKIGGVVGVAAVVWFGYLYVTNLQQKVIDLEKNITILEIVVDKKNEELTKKAIEAAEVRAEVVFFMRSEEEEATGLFLSLFKTAPVDQSIVDAAGALYRRWHPSHGIDVNNAILAATAMQTGGADILPQQEALCHAGGAGEKGVVA